MAPHLQNPLKLVSRLRAGSATVVDPSEGDDDDDRRVYTRLPWSLIDISLGR